MNIPLVYVEWTVNPVIFSIGSLSLRWYGLLLTIGFVLAYFTLQRVFKNENVSPDLLDKLAVWAIVWTLVGLRVGHFLFYETSYLLEHPLQVLLPFDEQWHFTGYQGLASHGGVLGIVLFLIYFAWKHKINIFWLFDRMAVCVLIPATLVRLGNLMNHEIVGSITTVPWAFNFTMGGPGIADTFRHPAQLYEAVVYLAAYLGILYYYFKIAKGKVPPGRLIGVLFVVVFIARFIIEFFKEVQVAKENTMTLDIGQWLSIPFVLVGIAFIAYSIRHQHQCPRVAPDKNNKNRKTSL
ncbi:MAG: prolipoprotein diacylglyceryl transferase [Bacteroidales bacterium]|jgi:prolipoprotein diacylglyceryl transferase|nr:prolipoprotein diacylglyceryl transferase [Bacteroidales bacterium]